MILRAFFLWVCVFFAVPMHGQPRVIAHRGGCVGAPENTISAIKTGIAGGVDFVEIDIHMSKDSVLVVSHDETVDRCTNGKGRIADMTWEELQSLDAGSWFSEAYSNERIPSLDSVMAFAEGKVGLFIEIKGYGKEYLGLENKLVELIQRHNAYEWVEVISFDHQALKRVYGLDPKIRLQKLLVSNLRALPFYLDRRLQWGSPKKVDFVQGYGYFHSVINKSLIKKVHRWGKQINAWTVNDPKRYQRLRELGIDGVTADDPMANNKK